MLLSVVMPVYNEYRLLPQIVRQVQAVDLGDLERELIMVELLTVQERQWLDAYHKRVRETLGQHLEPDVRKWLEEKTAPL